MPRPRKISDKPAPATSTIVVERRRTVHPQALAAALRTPPPTGVYACYTAHPTYGAPGCVQSSVGCLGVQIEVAPVMMFGLIDGATYSDYDGHKGPYTYDSASGILTMTDGSHQGWHYKRVAATAFQHSDEKGQESPYTCPLDEKKNPLKRPW